MRIAVVDDEQNEREVMRTYLSRYALENATNIEINVFSCADALLEHYRLIYDILILDVDMPGTNGVDAARRIREQDNSVVILFVTNMAQYAINGYEVEALDYIIKPVGYFDFSMKFRRAVSRAARRIGRELLLETTEGMRTVQVADIIYAETLGHYLVFHLKDSRELRVRGNMREQEQVLRDYYFCQTHKSYLVNLQYVEEIRTSSIRAAGTELPVGRTYKDKLVQEYLRFVRD